MSIAMNKKRKAILLMSIFLGFFGKALAADSEGLFVGDYFDTKNHPIAKDSAFFLDIIGGGNLNSFSYKERNPAQGGLAIYKKSKSLFSGLAGADLGYEKYFDDRNLYFGVEAEALFDFGTAKYDLMDRCVETKIRNSFGLYLKGGLPITTDGFLYLRVGPSLGKLKLSMDNYAGDKDSKWLIGVGGGLGYEYSLSYHTSLRVDYTFNYYQKARFENRLSGYEEHFSTISNRLTLGLGFHL